MDEQEIVEREHIETDKQREIVKRQRAYTVMTWAGIISGFALMWSLIYFVWFAGIPAANALRDSSTYTQQATKKLMEEDLPQIANDLKVTTGSIKDTSSNFKDISESGKQLMSGVNEEFKPLLHSVTDLSNQMRTSSANLFAEATHQVKQNGDGLSAVLSTATTTITELKEPALRAMNGLADITTKTATMIDTADPKIQEFLERGNKVMVKVEEGSGKLLLIADNGLKISTDAARISKDAADTVHNVLNPAPAPWYKRYILYPLKDGLGVGWAAVKIYNGLNR